MNSASTNDSISYNTGGSSSYNSLDISTTSATTTSHRYKTDLIQFLSTVQDCQVDFLPIISQEGLGSLGTGGFGSIGQGPVKKDTGFAFKRYHNRNGLSETQFVHMLAEVRILSLPPIRSHPNIVELRGVCWEVVRETEKPMPVLVYPKALWDLKQFMNTTEAKGMSLQQRVELCADIASAVATLHDYSK